MALRIVEYSEEGQRGVYLTPKQWGPVIDGRDILAEAAEEVYRKLGI